MDETYIQRVINGDIDSFRYFVAKYKDHSFTVARSIIKSDFVAEEAVQDAFIKAFLNLHKFKKKARFSTWLYKIVVNESLKKIKKKKPDFVDIDGLPNDNYPNPIAVRPVDTLHEEDQKEMINRILDELPSGESLMLRLYYLEEKDMKEIKFITGFSLSNIKVILHRARKHSAALIEKSYKNEINSIL
jgi:RNA polymerase sigma-70 factor (ECF subfamily)